MQLQSTAHHTLTHVAPTPTVDDKVSAAVHFLRSVEHMAAGSLGWAERAVTAYALLAQERLAVVPRPAWWKDDHLKAMSHRVLEARPDYSLAWRMRGEVLSAHLGYCNWAASPRSAAELLEAGRCLQRAAVLCPDELPADREAVVRQAVACFRAAQQPGAEGRAP